VTELAITSDGRIVPSGPRDPKLKYVTIGADGSIKRLVGARPKTGVTEISVGKRNAKVVKRSGSGTVIQQRVFGPDGRLKTVYTIDSGSSTFGSDLGYAFKQNVTKARRENKKKFGASDPFVRN